VGDGEDAIAESAEFAAPQRLNLRRGQRLPDSVPTLRQSTKMLGIAADGGFTRIGPLARTGHNDFAFGKPGEIAARHAEKPRKLRRGGMGYFAFRHCKTMETNCCCPELKAGTSFDTAWQLAHDMQNHITGIIVE
jgi:hypothetical protein